MDDDHTLAIYESISRLTKQMLVAARDSNWDRLIDLEHDCNENFARLFACSDSDAGSEDYKRRKAALIRDVLDDDAQIRLLVEPWLASLTALIGSTRQQRDLCRTYRMGE